RRFSSRRTRLPYFVMRASAAIRSRSWRAPQPQQAALRSCASDLSTKVQQTPSARACTLLTAGVQQADSVTGEGASLPYTVLSPVVRKVSHFTPCGSSIQLFSLFA